MSSSPVEVGAAQAGDGDLAVAMTEALHPIRVMQRITDRTLELLPAAQGAMVGVTEPDAITYACGSGNQAGLEGTTVDYDRSLSGLAVRHREVLQSPDATIDDRVDREACRRHSVRSLVCVPLLRPEGPIGVLAVNSPEPNAFDEQDVELLTRLAHFMSTAIGTARELYQVSTGLLAADGRRRDPADADGVLRPTTSSGRYVMSVLDPDAATRLDAERRIRQLLAAPERLGVVFQPIVEQPSGRVVAVEALARFSGEPVRTPDVWFREAHLCGRGVELELAALRAALRRIDELRPDVLLTVNVGPEAVLSPGFLEVLAHAPTERIVIELTEHTVVDDYPGLLDALHALRRRGLRIAIDDTGSGYSSLAHILKMAPDLIKLDRELTSGIDLDPVRRALAAALVTFAAETGARIVAEGVETDDELDVLRALGVPFAQGYLLGRPAPLEQLEVVTARAPGVTS